MRGIAWGFVAMVSVACLAKEPVDWVDTRYGMAIGSGSCVVGPCLPHGSAHPSPDSVWPMKGRAIPPPNGMYPGDPIEGFSQLHAQGTGGRPSYGLFLLRPCLRGRVCPPSPIAIAESKPYRFRCRLEESGIDVEIVPSAHGALCRFSSTSGLPISIDYDVRRKIGAACASTNAWLHRDGSVVTGGGTYSGNWNDTPYDCFFYSEESCAGTAMVVRIAVSFAGVDRARAWFDAELAGRSSEELAMSASEKWNNLLSAIFLADADPRECRRFYSNLYHAFVQPRDRTDDFLGWPPMVPIWDDHYTLWDTWKTLFPLMTLVDPSFVASNVNAFAARMRIYGECDTCMTQGRPYRTGQGGDEADNVIAEAFAKEIPGLDVDGAWNVLSKHAERRTKGYREIGWVPFGETEDYCHRMKSASSTLAFAYNDWCAAQVARRIGRSDMAAELYRRSANWTNVWDETLVDEPSGYRGFCRGRYRDGRFSRVNARSGDGVYFGPGDSRNYHGDFYEGCCWEYSYNVWQDVPGLIDRMGGREKFAKRLSYAFENGLIDYGNEPSFLTPWLFDWVGRPDLASKWVHAFRRRFTDCGCPGDDDSGAMGAMYVFLTCGLGPVAGQDLYALHAPAVRDLTIRLPQTGKSLRIVSSLPTDGSCFGEVYFNGVRLEKPFLRHSDLLMGGLLEFCACPINPVRLSDDRIESRLCPAN